MKIRMKTTALAVALASLSISAGAAGLGKLTVLSGLGQPLQAEVDVSATGDELSSMSAHLAPAEAFKQAGIELAPALAGIKFDVAKRQDGRPYLKLSSERPISEPFLDMLIQLDWAQGRLLREYTFLLDPPEAVLGRQHQQIAPVTPPEAKEAGAAMQPAARQAKVATATTREVKRGDTLRGIAQESKYDDVTVDQMLVAIFRANKGAFIGNNMNRLRAGAILSIPEREAIARTAPRDARRVVAVQAARFNAYRRRVAAVAAAAPVPEESAPKQTAAGKITPHMEEKAAAAAAEQRDQLKVSKSGGSSRETAKAAQTRIAALEEDIVAKDKALAEANSRVSDLEKNVAELQRLVELKNQNLAELQKQAAAGKAGAVPEAKKAEPFPSPAPKPSAAVAGIQAGGAAPQSEGKPGTPPGAERSAPGGTQPATAVPESPKPAEKPVEPAKPAEMAQAPAPQPAAPAESKRPEAPFKAAEGAKKAVAPKPLGEEPGFWSSFLANPLALYGGGGALAALLGLLGYRMSRGRKEVPPPPTPTTTTGKTAAQSVFGATGGQSVDTSASSIQTDFSHSGMAAIDADEGVDPVAEADVYMAYGRDAQAEEILLDALKSEPTRHAIHAKLLEIYAQRKSLKQFETLASELYAQTGGVGAEWEKAAAMGRKLDPVNPLYGGKPSTESAASVRPAPSASSIMAGAAAVGGAAVLAAGTAHGAASGESVEKFRDTLTKPVDSNRVRGRSDTGDADAATVAMPEAASPPEPGKPSGLDFNFELPTVEPAASAELSGKPAEGAGLDFDLGLDFAPTGETAPGLVQAKNAAVAPESGLAETFTWQAEPVATAAAQAADKAEAFAATESLVARGVIDFDLGSAPEPEEPPIRQAPKSDLPIMDLERTDVAGTLIDFNLEDLTASKPSGDIAVMDLERTDVGGSLLDFNFGLEEGAKQPVAKEAVPTLDLSEIDLDLPAASPHGESVPAAAATSAMVPEQGSATLEEGEDADVATKIELAKAYEEMGDGEGARELLQEVLNEGSAAQKAQARALLAKLG
jgi:pilus assembly protein FimV